MQRPIREFEALLVYLNMSSYSPLWTHSVDSFQVHEHSQLMPRVHALEHLPANNCIPQSTPASYAKLFPSSYVALCVISSSCYKRYYHLNTNVNGHTNVATGLS